ncbi:hypothetical protein [Brevundimonas diminuta]|uniref:hypothetical protein n=1 Tax=Brevundimonas diminuta TaxID=293 RepID=UPI000B34F02A|nr:hypothetical protein [Brevundimonas diminuta]
MNLKILSIYEKGNSSKEYVLLEVIADCNLDYYAIADTTYTGEGKISNRLRHFYWFASKAVNKGERLVLRTGKGKNDTYKTDAGKTVHRFFWGLGSPVWNDDGDAALLIQMKTWKATKA